MGKCGCSAGGGSDTMPGMTDEPSFRTLTADDAPALLELDRFAFPGGLEGVDPVDELEMLEWDRTRAATLPGTDGLAAQYSVFSLGLPVPGGEVDCAGLTWVAVHPQHRRRGLLTAMIRDHFAAAAARGEPVSALHASEGSIYGRFGYGLTGQQLRSVVSRGARLRAVAGADDVPVTITTADPDAHADLIGDCYEAARRNRPGMAGRRSRAVRRLRLGSAEDSGRDKEPLRILIAEAGTAGEPARGYAIFRRRMEFDHADVPQGSVQVRDLVARDPAAARALWGRLLDLDLMRTTRTDDRPLDDPLFALLEDRRAAVSTVVDSIWVRLLDVGRALAARRYTTEVDVAFAVRDPLIGDNDATWRLRGGPDHAECSRSDDEPAFRIGVRELGSAYLGSVTLGALASAGLVEVSDADALAAADRAFAWPVAVHCGWHF